MIILIQPYISSETVNRSGSRTIGLAGIGVTVTIVAHDETMNPLEVMFKQAIPQKGGQISQPDLEPNAATQWIFGKQLKPPYSCLRASRRFLGSFSYRGLLQGNRGAFSQLALC
jgi:hypothetical protein